ncbi:EPSP synthase-domain-containing protein [Pisolithus croceorrhizus]|nr:EPSP synthase-domain-containing protein [Pisolithus croceorrhizus]
MSVQKISILGKESIHVGFNLVQHISDTLLDTLPSSTYVLITDTNIAPLYLQPIAVTFAQATDVRFPNKSDSARPRFLTYTIPPGETTKTREGKAEIEDFLLRHRCTRDTVIIALGGGVIGDLVGFVAATFMRGVRVVQVPTSLLSMVDSAIGGKTAVDAPLGKNLIGAFWQPAYIFVDAAFLRTLPVRELANGLAEVIKTAAIWDEAAFALLEANSSTLLTCLSSSSPALDLDHPLLTLIISSINTKATIVSRDPREAHLRGLVNFGHSIGHAIEALVTPYVLHGECISAGMVLEAELARAAGVLGQVSLGRLRRCIESYGLPSTLSDKRILEAEKRIVAAGGQPISVDTLLDRMSVDKKNAGKLKRVVLLERIGKTRELRATGIADEDIRKVLCPAVRVVAGTPGTYAKPPLPPPLLEIPDADPTQLSGPVPNAQIAQASLVTPAPNGKATTDIPHITLSTPGSKSISNRALVLAALSKGTCRLKNLLHSDDTQVMMAALEQLKAATFTWADNGETLVVTGSGGALSAPPPGTQLYLGNAGTAARFLTTVCTIVSPPNTTATSRAETTTITGNARMKQRPIAPLVTALRDAGATIGYLESEGCLPLSIKPLGRLPGGTLTLDASLSSQYVSSILLCAPYAAEPTTLVLTGPAVISQLYIDMTIELMRDFGIEVTRERDAVSGDLLNIYHIPKGTYRVPESGEFVIESDASSATYPLAIAAITGTRCTLANIGSSSLQGDARFAKEVLEPMGCEVVQTETETTVTGPPEGKLRARGEVDMEPMTDAFLTACAVAAVATDGGVGEGAESGEGKNVTRIRGIANQRVKECNRIQAMMDQLAKLGISTRELPDGLEVYGRPLSQLTRGASIHCYDDHRVAMAFAVLATVVDGTILEEKRCVEKTWPNWWDDLENKLGVKVEGVELPKPAKPAHSSPAPKTPETIPSILLVGMRGSGKTYIGELAARALSLPLLDFDAEFSRVYQQPLRNFVLERGWAEFRKAEITLLLELMKTHARGWVVSLGGGIVETPEAREALKKYAKAGGCVVWVQRESEEIERYLESETERPAYGEPVRAVLERRAPWFEECSNYVFGNHTALPGGASALGSGALEAEVTRFFGHISGLRPNLVSTDDANRSYFLSLTYPDVTPALPKISELTTGVDAVELRVDLLRESGLKTPSPSYVSSQVFALRRATTLPIVFTVRTVSQGGAFPDDAPVEAGKLLKLALRLGVEYVDVETTLPPPLIQEIVSLKGSSQIVASFHDWTGSVKWDSVTMKAQYEAAAQIGDVVKLIGKANDVSDNFKLQDFVAKVAIASKPLIAINMGTAGQLSRVLNTTLTPVTHPLLPTAAAPGQMSVSDIHRALHLIGLLPARRFFLFGSPIGRSPSPTLHNTGFAALGLPHTYGLLEGESITDETRAILASPDFGGASVTIPLKLDIMSVLDGFTAPATAIGAVNTIIPCQSPEASKPRLLLGHNTDYLGIIGAIHAVSPGLRAPDAALVLGAGGTARAAVYALHTLGAKQIYLYNRTHAKATAIAEAFSSIPVRVVDKLGSWPAGAPSVVISTVPADATTIETGPGLEGKVYLPSNLLDASTKGVVVDMAYKPAETPLLALTKRIAPTWATVPGVEVLLEQGYAQFEQWTGRRCPREIVREKVLQWYNA